MIQSLDTAHELLDKAISAALVGQAYSSLQPGLA